MKQSVKLRLQRIGEGLALALVCILFPASTYGQPQNVQQDVQEKTLSLQTLPDQPVEVSNIRIGDKAVSLGVPIQAGEDWLKGLSFDVKNMTDKPIVHIHMGLLFGRLGGGRVPSLFLWSRGVDRMRKPQEQSAEVDEIEKKLAVNLHRGDSVRFEIAEKQLKQISNLLRQSETDLPKEEAAYVTLWVHRVDFADAEETSWARGLKMKRDKQDPSRLIPEHWKPGQRTSRTLPNESSSHTAKYSLLPQGNKINVKTSPIAYSLSTKPVLAGNHLLESGTNAKVATQGNCAEPAEFLFNLCGINQFFQCFFERYPFLGPGTIKLVTVRLPCFSFSGEFCLSTAPVTTPDGRECIITER